jgi:iron complex outermembrane receptor protein
MDVRVRTLALCGALFAATAAAQVPPPPTAGVVADNGLLDEVVVTGSHIAMPAADSTSTVQILTHADIERQGITTVTQLLNNLASAGSNNTSLDIVGSDSFAPGASSVGLRNLGEQSTLVLLNGRRVAPNALADYNLIFTNLDAFPVDAIDHVEVLLDGASAIYGSDAVAGVINIITRKDYQGVEVRADRQQSLLGDKFPTTTASVTAGIGNLATDRYNVFFNMDVFDRQSVMWTDYLGEVNHRMTSVSSQYGTPSSYTPYGNFIDTSTNDVAPGAGCPAADVIGGLCRYNRYARFQDIPDSRRVQSYLSAQYALTDATTAFAELSYSHDETDYISVYPYYGAELSQVLLKNGSNFYYMELPPTSPLNPFGGAGQDAEFRYRFTDAPDENNANNSQYRALTGLRGSFGSSTWESAIGIMGSREVNSEQGSFSATGFTREIGCYLISCATIDPNAPDNGTVATNPNFFNQPGGYKIGGPNSAAVLNTLFPEFGFTGSYTQEFWDGNLSGKLGQLWGGDAQYAVGAELRHETYAIEPTSNLVSGDIVGFGVSSVDSQRTFGAAYAEVTIPIVKRVFADLAARVDKYPGFGAHASPKVGLNWRLTDGFRLRGTFSAGFRAPNLVETANAVKVSYAPGTADPARCPSAQALVNALYNAYGQLPPTSAEAASILARIDTVYNNECNNSLFTITNGNPDLRPETSKTFAFGFILEQSQTLNVTADYWHITRADTISELSGSQIVTIANGGGTLPAGTSVSRAPFNPASDPSFTQNDSMLGGINDFTAFGVPAVGQLRGTTTQFANVYSQKTSGVDFTVKGRVPIGGNWMLDTTWNTTYLIGYYDASITNYNENLAGQYGFPRVASNLTVGFMHGHFDNGIRINFTGPQLLQEGSVDTNWTLQGCLAQNFTATQCHVASNVTTDYFLSYKPMPSMTIAFNMLNIFASKAPADLKGFGGTTGVIPPYSATQDVEGRMLKLGISYKFL